MSWLSFNPAFGDEIEFDTNPEDTGIMKQNLPLKHKWVVWEQIMQASDGKAAQYSDATRNVATFDSIQGFWKLWNNMPQPSELLDQKRMIREAGTGYHVIDALMLFREGIAPEWEDEENSAGGHFQFHLKSNLGGGQIDEYWNNLVLGVVGGTVEPEGMITGLRLVDKLSGPRSANGIRIEVWFGNFAAADKVEQLKGNVEKCMGTRLDGKINTAPKCDTKSHKH